MQYIQKTNQLQLLYFELSHHSAIILTMYLRDWFNKSFDINFNQSMSRAHVGKSFILKMFLFIIFEDVNITLYQACKCIYIYVNAVIQT